MSSETVSNVKMVHGHWVLQDHMAGYWVELEDGTFLDKVLEEQFEAEEDKKKLLDYKNQEGKTWDGEDGDWEVAAILHHEIQDSELWFVVSWVGYEDAKWNAWQSEEDLEEGSPVLLQEYKAKNGL